MQRKIRWVLVMVITFLVAIDVLQIFWVYNNYQSQRDQQRDLWGVSLSDAVTRYQYRYLTKRSAAPSTFYIVSSHDPIIYTVDSSDTIKKINFISSKIILDSVKGVLGHSQLIQMKHKATFDMIVFDSIFRVALSDKGLKGEYLLDTSAGGGARIPPRKGHPKEGDLVATKQNYKPSPYPERTFAMLLNSYGHIAVYATYKPDKSYVWQKLAGLIALSSVIFLATNFALIYVFRTIKQQKKINEIKNDFISNMTHELRTPITTATSAIDSILNHHGLDNKEKTKLYLETSREELQNLDMLVEKILNLAIEDKRDLELHYETIDIKSMISTIIKNHSLIRSKEVKFNFQPPGNDLLLKADKMHLANAINNIIDNAIKYSNEPADIDISYSADGQKISIIIKDKGRGISRAHIDDIFQPFYRVPHGDVHDVKGFGLGLSYVEKVIEKHGGTVSVESSPNNGSTFTLILPINKSNG